jgi:hypothetical protein
MMEKIIISNFFKKFSFWEKEFIIHFVNVKIDPSLQ